MSKKRVRADVAVVDAGLAESKSKAQAMIMAGLVSSEGRRIDKAGAMLAADAPLALDAPPRYVSRGGDKLAAALACFAPAGLAVARKICLDVGASTGGFTDCLLQHGAARVFAVDVGYGQLHPRLRDDSRVVVRERTNARHLTAGDFDGPVHLVVVDASFIGIGKLIGAIAGILAPGGELVALVKPQFEAGRAAASRNRGVIRDERERASAIASAVADIERAGFSVLAQSDSALAGPKGNIEHFVYGRREG